MLKAAEKRNSLTSDSKDRLTNLIREIPQIAELTQCTIFIDLIEEKSGIAYVLAEAHPQAGPALYSRSVVGNYAYEEDEPAVYKALRTGLPVTDTKAVTQEKRVVLQNVLPIECGNGQYFAALIMERGITTDVIREEEFEFLSMRNFTKLSLMSASDNNKLLIRESFHRVKNDLQFLASQGRICARNTDSEEARETLTCYVASILTIASLYDTINESAELHEIDILSLLKNLAESITGLAGEVLEITVRGDQLLLNGDEARVVAVTVNELICNAMKHGRMKDRKLRVNVEISKGNLFHTVTVADNGCGLSEDEKSKGIGLEILTTLVASVLGGTLQLFDTGSGVIAVLRFSR